MKSSFHVEAWCGLAWTDFVPFPLDLVGRRTLPSQGGMYRVRVEGRDELAYIGQTGRNLRERIRGLCNGALSAEMPFNDPHTAAPKLWSYRVGEGLAFEVSAAPMVLTKPDRMALECWLVWRYRLGTGHSPLCNFGRLHPRFITSKNRSTGVRGRKLEEGEMSNDNGSSLPPLNFYATSHAVDWMRLSWSPPFPLSKSSSRNAPISAGVYRLMSESSEVLYIGETSNLMQRLENHASVTLGEMLSFSFVELSDDFTRTQRLELECDLIGAFYEERRKAPTFQFGERVKLQ